MAKGGDGKVSNSLVAASCAAILAVYTAGYSRTREAAEKFEAQSHERRPARTERAAVVAEPEAAPVESSVAVATNAEPVAPETPTTEPIKAPAAAPEPVAKAIETPGPASVAEVPTPAPPATAPAIVATPPPVVAPEPPPSATPQVVAKWKDGTYTGWGTCRHGDIEARIVIHEGRIVEAGIAQCLTRYSCDVIDRLIPQPVQRQSPDIDYVSRSTESSDAYYFALVDALNKAIPSPASVQ